MDPTLVLATRLSMAFAACSALGAGYAAQVATVVAFGYTGTLAGLGWRSQGNGGWVGGADVLVDHVKMVGWAVTWASWPVLVLLWVPIVLAAIRVTRGTGREA